MSQFNYTFNLHDVKYRLNLTSHSIAIINSDTKASCYFSIYPSRDILTRNSPWVFTYEMYGYFRGSYLPVLKNYVSNAESTFVFDDKFTELDKFTSFCINSLDYNKDPVISTIPDDNFKKAWSRGFYRFFVNKDTFVNVNL